MITITGMDQSNGMKTGTELVKRGLADMLKGGVIMDVVPTPTKHA